MNFSMKNHTHTLGMPQLSAAAATDFFFFAFNRTTLSWEFDGLCIDTSLLLSQRPPSQCCKTHCAQSKPVDGFFFKLDLYIKRRFINEPKTTKKQRRILFSGQYVLVNYLHLLIFEMLTASKNKITVRTLATAERDDKRQQQAWKQKHQPMGQLYSVKCCVCALHFEWIQTFEWIQSAAIQSASGEFNEKLIACIWICCLHTYLDNKHMTQ